MSYHPILDEILAEMPVVRRETPTGVVEVFVHVARYDHGTPRVRIAQVRIDAKGRPWQRRSLASLSAEDAQQLASQLLVASSLIGGGESVSVHCTPGAGISP